MHRLENRCLCIRKGGSRGGHLWARSSEARHLDRNSKIRQRKGRPRMLHKALQTRQSSGFGAKRKRMPGLSARCRPLQRAVLPRHRSQCRASAGLVPGLRFGSGVTGRMTWGPGGAHLPRSDNGSRSSGLCIENRMVFYRHTSQGQHGKITPDRAMLDPTFARRRRHSSQALDVYFLLTVLDAVAVPDCCCAFSSCSGAIDVTRRAVLQIVG